MITHSLSSERRLPSLDNMTVGSICTSDVNSKKIWNALSLIQIQNIHILEEQNPKNQLNKKKKSTTTAYKKSSLKKEERETGFLRGRLFCHSEQIRSCIVFDTCTKKKKKKKTISNLDRGTADKQPQVMFRFGGSVVCNHSLSLDSYHIKKALKIHRPPTAVCNL